MGIDTEYADAVNYLQDAVNSALIRTDGALSTVEQIKELRRIAQELEDAGAGG